MLCLKAQATASKQGKQAHLVVDGKAAAAAAQHGVGAAGLAAQAAAAHAALAAVHQGLRARARHGHACRQHGGQPQAA